MASITVVDHGSADWEGIINSNFKILGDSVADTGWIGLTLKNTGTLSNGSYLKVRRIGSLFCISAQFTTTASGTIAIADIPTNLINATNWQYFVGYVNEKTALEFKVNDGYQLQVVVPSGAENQMMVLNAAVAI